MALAGRYYNNYGRKLLYSYVEGLTIKFVRPRCRSLHLDSIIFVSSILVKTSNFTVGDVETALSLEESAFKEQYGLDKPALDTDIVFNCRAGVRSLDAIETANRLGYSR